MNLEQFLIEYGRKDIYPMHMPGHKRNTQLFDMVNPYSIDVTEAGELDNMHQPEGIIKERIEKCKEVFGSRSTYYLINGSTGGILAGISASVKKGGKILMARNCHKSVYNAVYLRELEPVYIYPETDEEYGVSGGISPDEVKELLDENPDAELVMITSPTYEGVVSDIESIAQICHGKGVPLMVDSAHGAHFGFAEGLPKKSIACGADIVVESIHKTLPAFTQTSVLHFNSDIVQEARLKEFLTIYQTTSPSYVMMSGIDKCVEFVDSKEGRERFIWYVERLREFSRRMQNLKKIRIMCMGADSPEKHPLFHDFDMGKIVISVRNTGITGAELEEMLFSDYRIQLEMALGDYGLAMTSVCDTEEGFCRLENALAQIDGKLQKTDESYRVTQKQPQGVKEMRPSDAMEAETESIASSECEGRISKEYLYAYPPGIPLVVPGELITGEVLGFIDELMALGTDVHSSSNMWPERINVIQKVD